MKLDILVFAVHPDDAELGCSGTILKHIAEGKKVGIVDLTRGELGTRGSAEIRDQEAAHYVTFTVHQRIDVFTRPFYKDILLSSIKHCQDKKGLEVFAWVLMTNHMHMIVRSSTGKLSDTVRDFKKFTSQNSVMALPSNGSCAPKSLEGKPKISNP